MWPHGGVRGPRPSGLQGGGVRIRAHGKEPRPGAQHPKVVGSNPARYESAAVYRSEPRTPPLSCRGGMRARRGWTLLSVGFGLAVSAAGCGAAGHTTASRTSGPAAGGPATRSGETDRASIPKRTPQSALKRSVPSSKAVHPVVAPGLKTRGAAHSAVITDHATGRSCAQVFSLAKVSGYLRARFSVEQTRSTSPARVCAFGNGATYALTLEVNPHGQSAFAKQQRGDLQLGRDGVYSLSGVGTTAYWTDRLGTQRVVALFGKTYVAAVATFPHRYTIFGLVQVVKYAESANG
jgi:hypothetical protein